ncbi:hypothetical protein ACA910_006938 [Epithemia clementina (nom. ined.)]
MSVVLWWLIQASLWSLTSQVVAAATFSSSSSSSSSSSYSASPSLGDWFRARCGPTGRSTWFYQGGLYDPLTGDQIAHVEGLEIVQAISEPSPRSNANADDSKQQAPSKHSGKQKRKNPKIDATTTTEESDDDPGNAMDLLAIHSSLKNPNAKFQQSGTMLSRKIFIYRSKDDKKTLLQTVKLRPYSPERKIPLNQVVSAYATANTFIERSPSEWILHGEWPDGRTVWNQAVVHREDDSWLQQQQSPQSELPNESNKSKKQRGKEARLKTGPSSSSPSSSWSPPSSTKSLEFTVHVRPRFKNRMCGSKNSNKGPDLTIEPMKQQLAADSSNFTSATRSPPRSSWFSIGPSNSAKMTTGARETYHYEWIDSANNNRDFSQRRPDEGDERGRVGLRRQLFLRRRKGDNKMSSNSDARAPPFECSVRYTRYGEGPVWYGPNRFCMLELRGRRWPSHTPLPEHIEAWCQRHGWDTTISKSNTNNDDNSSTSKSDNDHNNAKYLILAFRKDDLDLKEILGQEAGKHQRGKNNKNGASSFLFQDWQHRVEDVGQQWWTKIRDWPGKKPF